MLQIDFAPIWFAHQVQPKMDCRSAVLTDAVREALGFTIPDKVGWVKRGPLRYAGRLVMDPIDDLDPVRLLAYQVLLDVLQLAVLLVDRIDGQAR